tara:strand:+ start:3963 stop:4187 length:225 start_codon:yes stop_codon:yes gene_type:complete
MSKSSKFHANYRWFPIPDLIGDGRNGKNKIAYEPVQVKELEELPVHLQSVNGEEAIVQTAGFILVKEIKTKGQT